MTFLIDLAGKLTILPEFSQKINCKNFLPTAYSDLPIYRTIQSSKKTKLSTVAFGNNVYGNGLTALLLDGKSADDIRSLGVVGTIGGNLFKDVVLTIDKKNSKVYTSTPFKPSFVRLTERIDCGILSNGVPEFAMKIGGRETKVILDTWQTGLLSLNSEQLLPIQKMEIEKINISDLSYGLTTTKGRAFKVDAISLVNVNLKNKAISINPKLVKPTAGLELLNYGLLSIDFQKGSVYYQTYESTVINESKTNSLAKIEAGKVNEITKDEFLAYIFDYKNNKDFVLKGDKPVIIDYWATWCAPCLKLSPVMDELAKKYKDRVIFYKINADKEKEICSRFNVNSLPTIFLIPAGKAPIVEIAPEPAKILSIIENDLLK